MQIKNIQHFSIKFFAKKNGGLWSAVFALVSAGRPQAVLTISIGSVSTSPQVPGAFPHSHIGRPKSSLIVFKPPHEPLIARLLKITPTAIAIITTPKATNVTINVFIYLCPVYSINFARCQSLPEDRSFKIQNRHNGSYLLQLRDYRAYLIRPAA